jgi:hypothetical protein
MSKRGQSNSPKSSIDGGGIRSHQQKKKREDGQAVSYKRTGEDGPGSSESSITGKGMQYFLVYILVLIYLLLIGRESALKLFDIFLETKKMKSYDQLNEQQLCNLALLQEWATYLSFDAVQDDLTHISLGNQNFIYRGM